MISTILIGGTSFLIISEYWKATVNLVRIEGSFISTLGIPIDEVLIREQREGLSFSGEARKT